MVVYQIWYGTLLACYIGVGIPPTENRVIQRAQSPEGKHSMTNETQTLADHLSETSLASDFGFEFTSKGEETFVSLGQVAMSDFDAKTSKDGKFITYTLAMKSAPLSKGGDGCTAKITFKAQTIEGKQARLQKDIDRRVRAFGTKKFTAKDGEWLLKQGWDIEQITARKIDLETARATELANKARREFTANNGTLARS